jgi:hypothetical protein
MGEPTRDDEWRRRYEAIYRAIDEGLDRIEKQFDELLLLSSMAKSLSPGMAATSNLRRIDNCLLI